MSSAHGMTSEELLQRHLQRQAMLNSCIVKDGDMFVPNQAARFLSDHRNSKPVSADRAKGFLIAMANDGLIEKHKGADGRLYFRRNQSTMKHASWRRKPDQKYRLGMYWPHLVGAC